jgi:hypothetical protein
MSMNGTLPSHKTSRPFSVTILAVVVLTLSVYYFTRWIVILRSWNFWAANLLPNSDWYLLLSGLVWGMIFLVGAAGLWLGWAPARKGMLILAPVYTAYLWIERFVLAQINHSSPNWPFFLIVTTLTFVWTYWVLFRKSAKQFFGE